MEGVGITGLLHNGLTWKREGGQKGKVIAAGYNG